VADSRHLVAIMFTDMVGFTASVQANEASALRLLREEESLIRPVFKAHRGREVKSTGDGFLVVFDSALRAVQCAIDVAQHLHQRNAEADGPPILVRIGIHLGDVEERNGDVFGDSVNIAARVEPLAEPGGICITEPVFGQVHNKISNKLEELGPRSFKNVRDPIPVYRVTLAWTSGVPPVARSGMPRLAILPLSNISPDPNDEYFADGLTEEMISVLSQLRELRVIARTSISQYKSTTKSIAQIGAELGVDAILEGSVRKSDDQLRITVQLIDVRTQEHTWSGTYDRKLDRVFAVQTDIAKRVAKQLKVTILAAESARLDGRAAVRPDSYLAYLRGRTLLHGYSHSSLEDARRAFDLAISLDPSNAAAHSGMADAVTVIAWHTAGLPFREAHEEARRLTLRALELDPNLPEAHASLALIHWDDESRNYVGAEKEILIALSLSPSYSLAHGWYSEILQDEGRGDEALRERLLAEASDPLWTDNVARAAIILIWLGRYEQAELKIQKVHALEPDGIWYHGLQGSLLLARGHTDAAIREFEEVEKRAEGAQLKAVSRAFRLAVAGRKDEARAILERERDGAMFPGLVGLILDVYAELGDVDACYRWMDEHLRLMPFQLVRLSPRHAAIRADPRYSALLKKVNLS
jgi:adenylate cyclase